MGEIPAGITTVIHCDWSTHPRKRWSARADRVDGTWHLTGPQQVLVDDAASWGAMVAPSADGCTLLAFDFPIGVPVAWGRATGESGFAQLLPQLGQGRWGSFYDVAHTSDDISIERPFYPNAPGGKKQEHLWTALGLSPATALRACERPVPGTHGGASPLFWTLGGKQVGKAALAGWSLLAPLVADGSAALWPFAGDIDDLTTPGRVIVAESYPGAYYTHCGGPMPGKGWSKRAQGDRRALFATALVAGAGASAGADWRRHARFDAELADAIQDGFGSQSVGEDMFDAVVGLIGALGALEASRPLAPPDDATRRWEGWILGMPTP